MSKRLLGLVLLLLPAAPAWADWAATGPAQNLAASKIVTTYSHEWTSSADDSTALDMTSCLHQKGLFEAKFDPSIGDSSTDARMVLRECDASDTPIGQCSKLLFPPNTVQGDWGTLTLHKPFVIADALQPTVGGDTAHVEVRCSVPQATELSTVEGGPSATLDAGSGPAIVAATSTSICPSGWYSDTSRNASKEATEPCLNPQFTHATDCTSLTTGSLGEYCWEQDSNRIFVCEPTAGGCDTAAEWQIAAEHTGTYNVMDYGAKGDGATDDTAAIQAAIDAANADHGQDPSVASDPHGGTVIVPGGIYMISDTILVHPNVTVRGTGYLGTMFRATAGFPQTAALEPMFKFACDAPGFCHGNRLEYLAMDGLGYPQVGVELNYSQERSALLNVGIYFVTKHCIKSANTVANYEIKGIDCTVGWGVDNDVGAVGIYLDSIDPPRDLSVISMGSVTTTDHNFVGLYVDYHQGLVTGLHFEGLGHVIQDIGTNNTYMNVSHIGSDTTIVAGRTNNYFSVGHTGGTSGATLEDTDNSVTYYDNQAPWWQKNSFIGEPILNRPSIIKAMIMQDAEAPGVCTGPPAGYAGWIYFDTSLGALCICTKASGGTWEWDQVGGADGTQANCG